MSQIDPKGKYTELSAKERVFRGGGYASSNKTLSKCHNTGIRTWGAIDFLVKYCGYVVTD